MPTENRSSNTEMVSLSRDLIDLTLAHLPNDSAAKWEIYDLLAQTAPQPHPDPIAWMVGTAFWWTKKEAERDAAETGLPIVGLGPLPRTAPAEQQHGEPVAIVTIGGNDKEVVEFLSHDLEVGTELYTHADPSEVERLPTPPIANFQGS